MESGVASLSSTALGSLAPCEPSRCPYCPDRRERHWTKWGFYSRYAHDLPQKIDIQRYRCTFVGRSFSLLPDGLLPYHDASTAALLEDLHAMGVEERPTSTWARFRGAARTTMRRLQACALRVIPRLRLPGQEGSLQPKPFLERLMALGADTIAAIFRAWKELEPKHSVLGFYAR